MLYIKSLEQAVPVFKALGSDIRIRLIQTLLEHQEMNMNELASSLGITNGALTSHVKKLEEAGILAILPEHSGHGNQKVCRINVDKILVDIASNNDSPAEDSYSIDIPIGNYFNYSVYPTCGLSTTDNLIGEVDDPRYFAHPSHVDAKMEEEVCKEGLLEGCVLLKIKARKLETVGDSLYSEVAPVRTLTTLTAVPYYTWGNRGENQMRVWMRGE